LETIAARFVDALRDEGHRAVSVGLAKELACEERVNRPLRIVNTVQSGHVAATDVCLHAEGNDLYVRFEGRLRTRIAYLRTVLRTAIFLCLTAIAIWLYLFGSGAFGGWIMDYAQKFAQDKYPGNPSGTALY
jgi:hypothetical protein